MRHILLLGDSLTEQGYQNMWVSKLQDVFRRRADVVNRGLSGYNTKWVRDLLSSPNTQHQVFPEYTLPNAAGAAVGPPSSTEQDDLQPVESSSASTLFVVIFFGANDAVAAGFPQHVPMDAFEDNLQCIVTHVLRTVKPTHGVILCTPPPICEAKYLQFVRETRDATVTESNRTMDRTRTYADAVMRVAAANRSMRVFGVDVFRAFTSAADWQDMFHDGLHFDARGGAVVFDAVYRCVEEQLELIPERDVPMDLPHWSTL